MGVKETSAMGFCNKYDNEESGWVKPEMSDQKGLNEFFGAKNRSQPAILRNKSGCPAQ